jgi:hypothetical protein
MSGPVFSVRIGPMNSNRITPTRCAFVLAAALLAFAGLTGALEASAKQKKGPSIGVWAGDATYTSPPCAPTA